MRKFLALLLIAILCFAFVLVSCSDEEASSSESLSQSESKSESDIESESQNDTQSESESQTESESQGESIHVHTEEILPEILPSCTEAGLSEGKKCSVCNEILIAQKPIDATGHSIGENLACDSCDFCDARLTAFIVDISSSMKELFGSTSRFYATIDAIKSAIVKMENNSYITVTAFDENLHQILPICKITEDNIDSVCEQIEYQLTHAYFYHYLNPDGTESNITVKSSDGSKYTNQGYLLPVDFSTKSGCDKTTYEYVKTYGTSYTPPISNVSITFAKTKAISKHIVFITDGMPSDESSLYNGTAFYMAKNGAVLYAIGVGCSQGSSVANNLNTLSGAGNGKSASANDENELTEAISTFATNKSRIVVKGEFVFLEQDSSSYRLINYTGKDSEITLPDGVDGRSYSVAKTAFSENSTIVSLTVPKGASQIEPYAFSSCEALAEVTILDGVELIGEYAFANCTSISSLTVPNSITPIRSGIFFECNNIEKATIPSAMLSIIPKEKLKTLTINDIEVRVTLPSCPVLESITISDCVSKLTARMFENCTALASITVSNGNANFESINGVLYDKGAKTLIKFPVAKAVSSFEIPSTVTQIEECAFTNCATLTDVKIPNGVSVIKTLAFQGCSQLNGIAIPSSVTSIESSAFDGCTSISRVDITDLQSWCNIYFGNSSSNPLYYAKALYLNGSLVTEIVIPSTIKQIKSFAFINCIALEGVRLDDGITSIGSYAFASCPTITSITLPSSVSSIGSYAFTGCSGIESVIIPKSLSSIGTGAFNGCTNIKEATMPTNAISFIPKNSLKSVVINGGAVIGANAFNGCSTLESISIPNSLTSVDSNAFSGCETLKYTVHDNLCYLGNDTNPYVLLVKAQDTSIESCAIHDQTTVVYPKALSNCKSLKNISIPDGIVSISTYDLPSGLNYAEYEGSFYLGNSSNPYVFLVCCADDSVNSIIIHENTKIIGDYAFNFMSYTHFGDIKIPDSVVSIGYNAFDYLSADSLTIGKGVKNIGSYAFSECSFSAIYVPSTVTLEKLNSLFWHSNIGTLYLEDAAFQAVEGEFSIGNVVVGHVHSYDDRRCVCGMTE